LDFKNNSAKKDKRLKPFDDLELSYNRIFGK